MLVPPLTYYKELASQKAIKEKEILSNNFEEEEIEGTEIELDSTAEAPIEILEISGNTIQDNRDGYNKFNSKIIGNGSINGVNFSIVDGKLSLNGDTSVNTYITNKVKIADLEEGSYTFVLKKSKGQSTAGNNQVGIYLDNDTERLVSLTPNFSTLSEEPILKSFTISENTEILFTFYINIVGVNFDDFELELMIIEGTYTTENVPGFEEYGEKPSFDFESEVVGVTGDTKTQFNNKNFLTINLLEKNKNSTINIFSSYGIEAEFLSDGGLKLNGTLTGTVALYLFGNNLSGTDVNLLLSAGNYYFSKSSEKISASLVYNNQFLSSIISSEKEIKIHGLRIQVNEGVSLNNEIIYFQIEKGSFATKIEPNKNQLHTISLGDRTLYGDENVRDYFNVTIDEEFYQKTGYKKVVDLNLTKNWKKYILDGINNKFNSKIESSTNNSFVTTNILDILKPEINSIIIKSYSNYFKGDFSANQLASNDITGIAITTSGYFRIVFGSTSEINTLELANDKLQELNSSGHPLYIVYQLKEPEIENITNKELINQIENFINSAFTYKEKTEIISNFYLKLKYKKDKYFNLNDRLKALEEANNG